MNWLEAINELKLPPLVSGNHSDGPGTGLCAMEMVAFMERLEHSDRPECTCQVIRDFVIATNDVLNDTERQKLLAVLPELVDTVVDPRHMRDREQFITRTAMRDLQHVNRGSYERDYERDPGVRFRGFSHAAHMGAEIHQLLGSVGGAVKLMAKVHAPWHLADILIGVLRGALKIGATQPKTQFKEPERVKELVEITYRPPESKLTMMGTMPMPVVKKTQYSFLSDCMV